MAEYNEVIGAIVKEAQAASGVEAVHAPSPSAGEKIIYRCTPAKYDGEWEHFRINLRFISRSMEDAFLRAGKVSAALCRPGDRGINPHGGGVITPGERLYVAREDSGNSGYIGKTGHFYVLSVFDVRFRRTAVEEYATVEPW